MMQYASLCNMQGFGFVTVCDHRGDTDDCLRVTVGIVSPIYKLCNPKTIIYAYHCLLCRISPIKLSQLILITLLFAVSRRRPCGCRLHHGLNSGAI